LIHFAGDFDAAAVGMHDALADRQPQTVVPIRRSARLRGPEKPVENARQILRRDPAAAVGHRGDDVLRFDARGYADRAAGLVVFDRVGDQIGEDEADLLRMAGEDRRLQFGAQFHLARRGGARQPLHLGARQFRQVGRDPRAPRPAFVQPGEFEQGFRQAAHLLRGFLAGEDRVAVLPEAALPAQGGLRVRDDHGQRRSQLVRRVGRELPLPRKRRVQPRERGVEHVGQLAQFAVHVRRRDPFGQVALRNALGRPAHVSDGADEQGGKQEAAAQAEGENARADERQHPGVVPQAGQLRRDVPADQHAVAPFGEVVGLAPRAANAMENAGFVAFALGPRQGLGLGGRPRQQHVFRAPDGEQVAVRRGELVRDAGRQAQRAAHRRFRRRRHPVQRAG